MMKAVLGLAAVWAAFAMAQSTPNVQIELREIDPAGVTSVAPHTRVFGRILYTTDAPVRLVLLPYRDGEPVLEGFYNSGSLQYAPGSGETIAWFGFDRPQHIDEIRAVANDFHGNVFAEDAIALNLNWRAGATQSPQADWVEPLLQAEKNVIAPRTEHGGFVSIIGAVVAPLFFLLVPLSVLLQIYAWRKLDGGRKRLVRWSGYAMGALWLFVIVTAVAGSNLSPIWLVFLSPLFVLWLGGLLVADRRRRHR